MNGLKSKYLGKIKLEIVSIKSKRGRKETDKYGFHHGMVFLDEDGKILWREPGHGMKKKKIEQHLQSYLKRIKQDEDQSG